MSYSFKHIQHLSMYLHVYLNNAKVFKSKYSKPEALFLWITGKRLNCAFILRFMTTTEFLFPETDTPFKAFEHRWDWIINDSKGLLVPC